ncbi:spheroidene monooxygenase [Rhodobacter sp. JA431]|uniref:spheroidene monooxygenase n=1 Tax=Rhodobacter sp. JA431 TaxID=570013 RepID=UPI000BD07C91|nr:spheroidene monooxygenase [Rhodobacter sp. JA431]SOB90736.1 spheroidene monooxygenase [Rhodobacter sp. JA431]
MAVATLSLFRFEGTSHLPWLMSQMVFARRPLHAEPRLRFFKLCGSGTGEGFTPKPNWHVWAIMSAFANEEDAQGVIHDNPVWQNWRKHSDEQLFIHLSPTSSRGSWGGRNPFIPEPDVDPGEGPVVALTRAAIKPHMATRFWSRVPDISQKVGTDPNLIFKIGIGEIPLFHQVTFSIWPDVKAMSQFARGDTPHGRAIRAAREQGWFTEELYARFRLLGIEGTWLGKNPLDARKDLEREAA